MKLLGYSFAILIALNFTACTVSYNGKVSGFGGGFGTKKSTDVNSKTQISRFQDSTILIVTKDQEFTNDENDIKESSNLISEASEKKQSKSKKSASSIINLNENRYEKSYTMIQRKLGNKVLNKLSKNNSSESSGTGGLGIVFLIVGIIMILFVSILLGILVSLIGLLLTTSGNKSNSTEAASPKQEEKKTEYLDVVYLKNGSIIKGMIIEQIPNVSVKIQTADGSVFVHNMDDVLKMTKEPK